MWSLWIEFSALTLLVALLIWSCRRRRRQFNQSASQAVLTPGHGFDTTAVKQRLDHLRRDYVAGASPRSRNTPGHDFLVAAIRQSLRRWSYFRPAKAEALADKSPSTRNGGG